MTTEAGKYAGVNFTYDQVGRLSSLTRTTNWDFATTINTSFTLDLLDRVTSITHEKISGEESVSLSQFSYTYDANGRVVASTGPEGSLSYAMDTNGQLLSVTGSRADNYSFDANGNRTSNSTAAGNLLLNDGQYSYTYDLEGNQKTKTRISDGQMTEFFWDYRNQLTKAMVKDANGVLLKELRFTYDVEGRRVGSWVDADGAGPGEPDQVWTVFDGVNPYMDFDGEGLLKTRYLYGPGIDELFARIGAGEDPEWYLVDRLGSVRQIVDASGAVLDEITYDSFGGILSETNPAQGDRFKFTGREYSPELGIYYYRARWYDPGSGRFISQDPIGFSAGDANLYRYVGNAPGDATDPEGLEGFRPGDFNFPSISQHIVLSFSGSAYPKPENENKTGWDYYAECFTTALDMLGNQPWGTVYFGKDKNIDDVRKYLARQSGRIEYLAFDQHGGASSGCISLSPKDTFSTGELGAYNRALKDGMTNSDFFKDTHKKIAFLLYLKERATFGLTEPIKGKVMTMILSSVKVEAHHLGTNYWMTFKKFLVQILK